MSEQFFAEYQGTTTTVPRSPKDFVGVVGHYGLGNELIDRPPAQRTRGPVRRRQRMGGILTHYYQSAA